MATETVELVVESKSQTPERLAQVLKERGYKSVQTERITDEPERAPEPPKVETPTPETPKPSDAAPAQVPVPAGEPGGQPAAEGQPPVGETPAASEAANEVKQQEQRKRPGGLTRKLHKKDAEIGNLSAALAEEKRRREELERKLAETSAAAAIQPKPEAPKTEPKPKPKFEDFADQDDQLSAYMDARDQWAEEERERKAAEKRAPEAKTAPSADDPVAAAVERWKPKIEAVKAKHSDYDDVIKKNGNVRSSPLMNFTMDVRETGAEIQYWLATHPEECERIADLTWTEQGTTLAEIERRRRALDREFDKIEAEIASAAPAEEEEEDPVSAEADGADDPPNPPEPASRETRPPAPATPPAAQVPAQPAPPAIVPTPKTEPPRPVGNRGAATVKRLDQMSADDLRKLDPEEYRRKRGL